MKPENTSPTTNPSKAGQAARKAHDAVDRVYQAVLRPDRSLEPEVGKKPWLAAVLSLVVVGAGQIYNRQLAKAAMLFLAFYVVGGALLLLYLLLNWALKVGQRMPEMTYTFCIVWGSMWLFAIVDAYRVAEALRTGQLVIRYGWLRQTAHFAARFIPFAGMVAPTETVRPEDVNKRVGEAVKDVVKDYAVEWLAVRILRYTCLGLGALLIIIGIIAGVRPLIAFGGIVIVAGVLLFLA
jgi:hypothetical protein